MLSAWFRRAPKLCYRSALTSWPALGSVNSRRCATSVVPKTLRSTRSLGSPRISSCSTVKRTELKITMRSLLQASTDAVGAPTQRSTLGIDGAAVQRSAFVPIWRRPWMSISSATYGASLLAHLGIGLVQVDSDDAYPTVELAEIALAAPDLVLVPSEPYEFKPAHLGELHEALPMAEIIEIDGQDLFWWGSRTPSAVSRLQAALAPQSTR